MKTSYAFIGFGIAILLYVWSAISCHALSIYSNKTAIGSSVLVGVFFVVIGIASYLSS